MNKMLRLAWIFLAIGCGTGGGASDGGGDDGRQDGGGEEPPAPSRVIGRIQIIENMYEGSASSSLVAAEFWDGLQPSAQGLVQTVGDCRLLVGEFDKPWDCTPECVAGEEACISGACVAYPALAHGGTVTIGGLVRSVVLEPDGTGRYPAVYDLPASVFSAGDSIRATSTGGGTPALDLTAPGVADLIADPASFDFVPGQDYRVTWEPAGGGSRIQLLLQTGWHGAVNLTTIWCETDDDGELVVPASLTSQFQIPSCGECESSYLGRISRDVVDFGRGPIELLVSSRHAFVAWW